MKRCKLCRWLNYDFLHARYEAFQKPVCGVHGLCTVDLNSERQENLDGRGSCQFMPKERYIQLSLFD